MDNLSDFQKQNLNFSFFKPNDLGSLLSDIDSDVEDREMERIFSSEKKEFVKYMNSALSDEEEGDFNRIALQLVSAWTKNETKLILAGNMKGLTKPKSVQDAFGTLRSKHKRLVEIFKKIFRQENTSLTHEEENFLASFLRLDSERFKDFITCCSLYDMCFYDGNKSVIQVAMDAFKKDIPFFNAWVSKENELLNVMIDGEKEFHEKSLRGCDHIARNFVFAEAVLKNIPPEGWTNEVVLSLGRWVFDKDIPVSYLRDFAKKLEKCPADKISDYFGFLSDLLHMDTQQFKDFSYDGVFQLLSYLKEDKAIQVAKIFYEKSGDILMKNISKTFSMEDWEKHAQFLSQTRVGIQQLIKTTTIENPLVWRLYAKGNLDKDDLKRILNYAIKNDKRDFLMMKKPVHFSKEFPCYEDLKNFFKDKSSAQGTRFFNSFSWKGDSVDDCCKLLKDFVSSSAIHFYYYQHLGMFNHWAKEKSNYKILSFCYGENADTNPSPKSQISEKELKALWLHQDENGKTPWHYICARKDIEDKMCFQRRFKELPGLFLDACSIQDKDGKTPLDYALTDSKFMKNLVEKIPQVKNALEKQGIQWSETSIVRKKENPVELQETNKTIKLAPAVPVAPIIDMEKVEEAEKEKISQSIKQALQKRQNLILLGRERDFALTYSVLKDIDSDTAYRQDVIVHLQKFLATPIEQDFIVRGATRWKTFNGTKTNINEFSICPLSGHAESMPRLYCKKELFSRQNTECAITNRREIEKKKNKIQPLTIWVAVKKGDKRKQSADAQQAENVGFVNDGQPYDGNRIVNNSPWSLLDLSGISFKMPMHLMGPKGGNPGL